MSALLSLLAVAVSSAAAARAGDAAVALASADADLEASDPRGVGQDVGNIYAGLDDDGDPEMAKLRRGNAHHASEIQSLRKRESGFNNKFSEGPSALDIPLKPVRRSSSQTRSSGYGSLGPLETGRKPISFRRGGRPKRGRARGGSDAGVASRGDLYECKPQTGTRCQVYAGPLGDTSTSTKHEQLDEGDTIRLSPPGPGQANKQTQTVVDSIGGRWVYAKHFKKKHVNSQARKQSTREAAGRRRELKSCLLYTSPSPRDRTRSRMPSSA